MAVLLRKERRFDTLAMSASMSAVFLVVIVVVVIVNPVTYNPIVIRFTLFIHSKLYCSTIQMRFTY